MKSRPKEPVDPGDRAHRELSAILLLLWLWSWGLGCAHEGSVPLNDRVVVAAPVEVVEPYQPPLIRDLSPVWEAERAFNAAEVALRIAHNGYGNLWEARACYRRRLCELMTAILRAVPMGLPVPPCEEDPCFDDSFQPSP